MAHAALVLDGDVAVGWCEYGTPGSCRASIAGRTTRRHRTWCPTTDSRDTQGKRISASFLCNGTRSQFERAGFEFARSKAKYNCVMRTTVEPA